MNQMRIFFSNIEFTDELIAMLNKTYSESEDKYVMLDIELTDDLVSILDKTY